MLFLFFHRPTKRYIDQPVPTKKRSQKTDVVSLQLPFPPPPMRHGPPVPLPPSQNSPSLNQHASPERRPSGASHLSASPSTRSHLSASPPASSLSTVCHLSSLSPLPASHQSTPSHLSSHQISSLSPLPQTSHHSTASHLPASHPSSLPLLPQTNQHSTPGHLSSLQPQANHHSTANHLPASVKRPGPSSGMPITPIPSISIISISIISSLNYYPILSQLRSDDAILCLTTNNLCSVFNYSFLFSGIDRYLVSTLEEIKDRLATLEKAVANISRSDTREITLPDELTLPLQNYEDMDVLEQRIEDRHCRKDLVYK